MSALIRVSRHSGTFRWWHKSPTPGLFPTFKAPLPVNHEAAKKVKAHKPRHDKRNRIFFLIRYCPFIPTSLYYARGEKEVGKRYSPARLVLKTDTKLFILIISNHSLWIGIVLIHSPQLESFPSEFFQCNMIRSAVRTCSNLYVHSFN
ncbi:hypothetical protein CDAR_101801 [Caerostris darwini]|uniref:Uncharacterized protein n=1 Tax=Caerostris darwini TaxID=1538125 RepID=A0AAV4SBB5_9ARAC|nr:hypothetical protein CDAR_101801 [Caerostris darwini]